MLLLLLSFVAGILTVLAPCVLPLLPIIIGGSLSGDARQKSRPYIIVVSLIVSLVAFTLLLKVSTVLIGVNPKVWVYVSGSIVIALGLVSLFPGIWEQLIVRLNWQARSQRFLGVGFRNKGAVVGPVLIGLALGPVFSSCSPTYAFILATVLPRNLLSGLIYITSYCLGLSLVLLGIAVSGRKFISKFQWASDPRSIFRRSLGILFIVVGLAIITGWDIKSEAFVADHIPVNFTNIEQQLFDKSQKKTNLSPVDNSGLLNIPATPAPELVGLQAWINSDPQTIANLRGKVVLIDFWTYSCINCVRTLPYVEKWYETYKDKGFVVIGVHAPEFAFEKVESNVRRAVHDDHITYPVAMDNNLATWQAYDNQYWPAHYLIDKDGNIRETHFGEGGYQETEQAIQLLLGTQGPLVTSADNTQNSSQITPETYFGTARAAGYVGLPNLSSGDQTYTTKAVNTGEWTLGGSWSVAEDGITSKQNAKLTYKVQAKDVYLVVGSGGNQKLNVTIDGAPSNVSDESLNNGVLQLDGARLYHIAHFANVREATIQLSLPSGVKINTFTFGS